MTALVLNDHFAHAHNSVAVADQEYTAAKEHYREVLKYRNPLNEDHNRRFRDAADRLEAARERWLDVLVSGR